jgi:hypothetical protein
MPDASRKNPDTAPEAPAQARRALAPFRHGVFTAIWLGTLASNMGVWVQSVGAAWLMTLITASPDWVAAVQSASTLPVFLFALVGGVLTAGSPR